MVICTIREFSFFLELKEHCILGRFISVPIIWGTQNFEPFSYSGAWDRMKKQVEILNYYFQWFSFLEIECFSHFSMCCFLTVGWWLPWNYQARNIFLWGHIGGFSVTKLRGNKGKMFGRSSLGFPGHNFDCVGWSGKLGISAVSFSFEPVLEK